jgi:hypothetical protein
MTLEGAAVWNGIEAVAAERVASCQPPDRHPPASHEPETLDGFEPVCGTRGDIPAGSGVKR